MINQQTITQIVDTARIDEVVGDFVDLKKRGTSLIGLCPFHNEKTPSFHVSVSKGLYKCFGCGKGGDAVGFVMEHEKYSYPEALKYLAQKYNITVEETFDYAENKEEQQHRELLMQAVNYASQHYQNNLFKSEEGKKIALSYFIERGFREDTIQKFQLGYALDTWDDWSNYAIKAGYTDSVLEETGLSIRGEKNNLYDRFRARVIFPIHNFTGRVIGFGGRILTSDKKAAKYINSPESEIYHKGNILYGLFFARKSIRDLDNCYLVEGYADVISVHQAGIENVVASSGTALTIEQIKLIARFTKNVTILFDGDAAGIKASLRGVDMILEEGLNVKVVLFPDGHDPDSYIKQVGVTAFKDHIKNHQKDFILYKTDTLLKDAENDPIKRAAVIREVVESIAKIPDGIIASIFVRECSQLLDIEERILLAELNKIKLAKLSKSTKNLTSSDPIGSVTQNAATEIPSPPSTVGSEEIQEKEIIRILLNYGHQIATWESNIYIAQYIIRELSDVTISSQLCQKIWQEYNTQIQQSQIPTQRHFVNHTDTEIQNLAVSSLATPYTLSENWYKMHRIFVPNEETILEYAVKNAINHLKKRKIDSLIEQIRTELKMATSEDDQLILLDKYRKLKAIEAQLSALLGTVIVK